METYRIDRETDQERIWETFDGGIIKKVNNQSNINVDYEEHDYIEPDVDSYLEEDTTNSDDYLFYNCNFRFEHYQGWTLVSGEDHLISKQELSGIYKYLKKGKKYEDDFLLYHASDFLSKRYHRRKFYGEITTLNMNLANDVSNIRFFNNYKFLKFNKKFNTKKLKNKI